VSADYTDEERRELLVAARRALRGEHAGASAPMSPKLVEQKRAAFVTLTSHGALRGCLGSLAADRPLALAIPELAISSATEDPRFPRVTRGEVDDLRIEISILSPPSDARPQDVRVGTHGLIVERGRRRGLLLPQVASEHHLDREAFLDAVCQKAGLPPDAWRDPETRLQTFTAEVFGEET
jgi:AmmeMemoRadiSam system protein A